MREEKGTTGLQIGRLYRMLLGCLAVLRAEAYNLFPGYNGSLVLWRPFASSLIFHPGMIFAKFPF